MNMHNGADYYFKHSGGGKVNSADKIRELKFKFSSGNMTAGTYTIYGMNK